MQRNRMGMFCLSLALHVVILIALIISYEFHVPTPVIENSDARNVINVVMVGDVAESKIVPQELSNPPPPEPAKTIAKPAKIPQQEVKDKGKSHPDENAIALKEAAKKQAEQKALAQKKLQELQAKNLLADIQTQQEKKKKLTQKKLKKHFEKTLREQSELTLRKQLLDESLQLEAKEEKPSQGEINKFKTLIIQAISHHWLVPTGADKKLYCELMIKLAPSGTVLEVLLIKSSGDTALDRSARAAVLKASPLPVPEKAADFSAFKEFVLKVKPENIASDNTLS